MKKALLSILIVLFIILIYFLAFNKIKIGEVWSSKTIGDIKQNSEELNNRINYAKQLNNQAYLEAKESIASSIEQLNKTKEKYNLKTAALAEDFNLGIIEVKRYKIERLWITLANYAKNENIELILDLTESNITTEESTEQLYDINVTLEGSYIGITDFIYDIEKDDTLNFKILGFNLEPSVQVVVDTNNKNKKKTTDNTVENTTGNTVENTTADTTGSTTQNTNNEEITYIDVNKLKATFKIENIGIEFN